MSVRFAGYAAIFDRPDRGGDTIRPGAFARSLASLSGGAGEVPLLFQHRRGSAIGRIEAIAEDAKGLRVIARVEDAALAGRVGAGEVAGLSFGYRVRAGRETGMRARELTELELVEVSLVGVPMQPLARVHAVA